MNIPGDRRPGRAARSSPGRVEAGPDDVGHQTALTDHCTSAEEGEPLGLSEAGWVAGKPICVFVTHTVTLHRRGKDDVCAAVVGMVDASEFHVGNEDFD